MIPSRCWDRPRRRPSNSLPAPRAHDPRTPDQDRDTTAWAARCRRRGNTRSRRPPEAPPHHATIVRQRDALTSGHGGTEAGGEAEWSADRRAAILANAAELFARDGVAATSMRDIGRAAGILGGSLYHHFESKQGMLAEIL